MNFATGYFYVCFLLGTLQCVKCIITPTRQSSSKCFTDCVETFHVNLQSSLSEYQTIDQLHGVKLRTFLRETDEEDLQTFCGDIYKPFLICMTKCPKSLGRDWGIWDYRALSHICMDNLAEMKEGISCLHEASDQTEEVCRNEFSNHKYYFDYVEYYFGEKLGEDQAGEEIRNLLDNFCPTISVLMDCERPMLEGHCGKNLTKHEVDLFYMYLGTVQSRLYAAKLMNYFPQSCKTIYDNYFPPSQLVHPPTSESKEVEIAPLVTSASSSSSSSSQCFTNCVREFHVSTELNAPEFTQMDELHDLDLRQFVRKSNVNELENYCKHIYGPFLTCIANCPKSVGRDWGIWDYKSLTSICVDHLEAYKANLTCIKRMDETFTACDHEQMQHKNNLRNVEHQMINPTQQIHATLQQFCNTLEQLLQCEERTTIQQCGQQMTTVEQELHLMYLSTIQTRLHNSNLDHAFPDNCMKFYRHLTDPATGTHTEADQIDHHVPAVVQQSPCVRQCVNNYRNFTRSGDLHRFNHIDTLHGVDLRRFVRFSYSEELRFYCDSAYQPLMICLTNCPKSSDRLVTSWDYIALTHICIDHLNDFATKLGCLRGVDEKLVCKTESHEYVTVFNKLQVEADRPMNYNSGPILHSLLNDYCAKLNDLIACEKPTLSRECTEYTADLEHDILIMYVATVKGRMVNANIGDYFPLNCSELYARLKVHPIPESSVSGTQRFTIFSLQLVLFVILVTFVLV